MKIQDIEAYEVLASGGYPSIEAQVRLDDGTKATASVPYGASAGSHEATVMTDEDEKRWQGKGMLRAIEQVNSTIRIALVGMEAQKQQEIDRRMIELDGTPRKERLGGNAILSVSLAIARAAARSLNKPFYRYIMNAYELDNDLSSLPQPMMVVIEGGKHADKSTDLQEFCLSAVRQASVKENVRMILESYHELKRVLTKEGFSTNVGNEGAFAPSGILSNEAPFKYMLQAIEQAGYHPAEEVSFSIDAAASEFYENGTYQLRLEDNQLQADELVAYYSQWYEQYPIVTMEDPLDEDDWENWTKAREAADAHEVTLIGDDLTVTNPERIQKAIKMQAISGVLIKLNQIGSLTETVEACKLARKHNLMTVTSHRGGGETNDTAMIDVAAAVGSAFVKVGPTRGERVVKYNRLMAIERELMHTG